MKPNHPVGIINVIFYVSALLLASQAFHLLCHPSKNPEILFLFSYQKFGVICLLLLATFLSFFYAKKLSHRKSFDFFCNIKVIPYFIILSILSVAYLLNLNTGFSTGIDFATQLKATLQWDEGFIDKWNHLMKVDIISLKNETETWLFRPPGAILYYVPFIQLPIPKGEALRLAQLLLCLIICFSWIKIAKYLCLSTSLQLLLGIILALWSCNDLSFVGNVQLLVTAYSSMCTLFALLVLLKSKPDNIFQSSSILFLAVLSIILGCVVFLKISAIIYNFTILLSLYVMLIRKDFKKLSVYLAFILSFILFCLPYWVLKIINAAHGIELNEVYQQDYNSQWLTQELWGQYFTETTQIPAVILSLLASFSTFSTFHLSQTLLSNFLTFTGWFDNIILSFEVNQRVIYKGLVGIVFSVSLIFYFFRYSSLTKSSKYYWIILLFCPFLIFAYLANKHGYNYLITGTYSQQYIPLFCLLILWLTFNYWEHKKKAPVFVISVLFFSIGMFSYSNLVSLGNAAKNRFANRSLSSTHFDHPFYGRDIETVEKVISEHRISDQIPIIYLGNSSIVEMSIAFSGIYGGLSNISTLIQENKFSIPDISTEAIIVVDARLNVRELDLIKSLISKHKSSYLLDLPETAKVIKIES